MNCARSRIPQLVQPVGTLDIKSIITLIPLAWVGRLDLISATVDEIRTTEVVRDEVLTEGKRGTALLKSFLDDVSICDTSSEAYSDNPYQPSHRQWERIPPSMPLFLWS